MGSWYRNILGRLSASVDPRFVTLDPGCTFNPTISLIWSKSMQIAVPSPGFAPDLNLKSQNLRIESNLKLETFFFILPSDPVPVLQECVSAGPCHSFTERISLTVWRICVDYTSQHETCFSKWRPSKPSWISLVPSNHLISLLSFEAQRVSEAKLSTRGFERCSRCSGLNQGPSAKLLDELCLQGGFHALSALPCCTGCTLFARICKNIQNSHTKQWNITSIVV